MRLLVVSNLYPPDVQGGYEILCEQVVRGLSARGHDVFVLTSGTEPAGGVDPDARVLRRLGLTAPFPEPVKASRGRSGRLHRANAAIAREAIREIRPDRIFIWSQLRLTLGCAEAAEASGLPVTYTFNDEHPAGFLPRRTDGTMRSWAGALADALFPRTRITSLRLAHTTCISATLKNALLEKGVEIPKSRVIHQGIPLERFPPHLERTRGARFRILYAGQLHEYKGVHTLLEAAALVAAAGAFPFEIAIAGEGSAAYKQRLEALAREAGAPVRFLGRVPHGEIPALYRAHDAFVFPSIWREPFGLTHLEAMASGTPVISTTEGGPGEFLVDRENALTFRAGDAPALAHAVCLMATDLPLATRLALAARHMVEIRFTLDRYVAELEAFLQEPPS